MYLGRLLAEAADANTKTPAHTKAILHAAIFRLPCSVCTPGNGQELQTWHELT